MLPSASFSCQGTTTTSSFCCDPSSASVVSNRSCRSITQQQQQKNNNNDPSASVSSKKNNIAPSVVASIRSASRSVVAPSSSGTKQQLVPSAYSSRDDPLAFFHYSGISSPYHGNGVGGYGLHPGNQWNFTIPSNTMSFYQRVNSNNNNSQKQQIPKYAPQQSFRARPSYLNPWQTPSFFCNSGAYQSLTNNAVTAFQNCSTLQQQCAVPNKRPFENLAEQNKLYRFYDRNVLHTNPTGRAHSIPSNVVAHRSYTPPASQQTYFALNKQQQDQSLNSAPQFFSNSLQQQQIPPQAPQWNQPYQPLLTFQQQQQQQLPLQAPQWNQSYQPLLTFQQQQPFSYPSYPSFQPFAQNQLYPAPDAASYRFPLPSNPSQQMWSLY